MWAKLIEIIERRWQESRQPRKQLAKAIVVLYGALMNCHQAFLRHRNDPNLDTLRNWALSLDSLITTINNLEDTLRIFDASLYARLKHYVASERRQAQSCRPEALAQMGLEELSYLLSEDPLEPFKPVTGQVDFDSISNTDFEDAVRQLGDFIKTNFKLEEIFEYS